MKKLIKITIYAILALLLCSTVVFARSDSIPAIYSASVDGDTAKFVIDGKATTVRFLGIDTPKTVHPSKQAEPYGKEASEFTKNALKNANKIILEFDETAKEKDKYGRLLTWVWVDDTLLQEQLVKQGLAKTYMLSKKSKYYPVLNTVQNTAKTKKLGIWSDEKYVFPEEKVANETSDIDTYIEEIIVISIAVISVVSYIITSTRKRKAKRKRKQGGKI